MLTESSSSVSPTKRLFTRTNLPSLDFLLNFNRCLSSAGLLPPPLDPTYPSTRLHTTPAYAETYLPRLTELSLDRNVYLKLLPPVLSAAAPQDGAKESGRAAHDWWNDEEEVKRVTRLYGTYLIPSLRSQVVPETMISSYSDTRHGMFRVPPDHLWFFTATRRLHGIEPCPARTMVQYRKDGGQ